MLPLFMRIQGNIILRILGNIVVYTCILRNIVMRILGNVFSNIMGNCLCTHIVLFVNLGVELGHGTSQVHHCVSHGTNY